MNFIPKKLLHVCWSIPDKSIFLFLSKNFYRFLQTLKNEFRKMNYKNWQGTIGQLINGTSMIYQTVIQLINCIFVA